MLAKLDVLLAWKMPPSMNEGFAGSAAYLICVIVNVFARWSPTQMSLAIVSSKTVLVLLSNALEAGCPLLAWVSALLEPINVLTPDRSAANRNRPARRWDNTDLAKISGTYGDYLLNKVSKVFPQLKAKVL